MGRDMGRTTAGKPQGRHQYHRLTAVQIRALTRVGRYADGNGLYLVIDRDCLKRWKFIYQTQRRRHELGLGPLRTVTLAQARAAAAALQQIAAQGGDVLATHRQSRRRVTSQPTFTTVAREVHKSHAKSFSNLKHRAQWITTLEQYAFPVCGDTPIDRVDSASVLKILAPIWTAKPETARRVRQRLSTVFAYAKALHYRSGDDPTEGVETTLPKSVREPGSHAALPYAQVPTFVKALRDRPKALAVTKLAFEFLVLTAARANEVLQACWDEIHEDAREWTIPAARMKRRRQHRVPLSGRALEILAQARALGNPTLVFPGGSRRGGLSTGTFLKLLDDMHYGQYTAHGFRSSFRDWAAEQRWPDDVCEFALAHAIRNKAKAAYYRTELVEQRRPLMEAWAMFATSDCS